MGDNMHKYIQNNVSSSKNPEKLFDFGLLMLKANKVWKALLAFKQAYEIKPKEARFLSYYGLCIAKVEKNATKAIPLCEKAVEKNIFHADLFCNLGKVYLQKRDRKKAYNAFIKGLSIDKRNKELINELKKMGIRKQPFFTFWSVVPINQLKARSDTWMPESYLKKLTNQRRMPLCPN